MKLVEPFQY